MVLAPPDLRECDKGPTTESASHHLLEDVQLSEVLPVRPEFWAVV